MAGLLSAVVVAAGCSGKTEDGGTTEDTGTAADVAADTTKDTTPADTGSPMDTAMGIPDVPGSLFDAEIPDVVFEGGTTAKGCFDCAADQCKSQVQACDADPRCRGVLLCGLTNCDFSNTMCLLGCTDKFGVSVTDPIIIGTLYPLAQCVQKKCTDACPSVGGAGDGGTKSDASSSDASSTDAKSDATGDAKTDGSAEGGSSGFAPKLPGSHAEADMTVIDALSATLSSFEAAPGAKQGLIEHLSRAH